MFIDSNITKWKLPPWSDDERKDMNKTVLDKVSTHFSTGHLVVAGSDTAHPYGKWLVAMNKLSAGRHVNVGPSQPESRQLIDISGAKMKMVAEAYTEPEPHFAQILKVSEIEPIEVYPKPENKDLSAVWVTTHLIAEWNGITDRCWLVATEQSSARSIHRICRTISKNSTASRQELWRAHPRHVPLSAPSAKDRSMGKFATERPPALPRIR
jgi:nitrous-oxide reductase